MLFDETVRAKETSTRNRRPGPPDGAYGFLDMDEFACGDLDGWEELGSRRPDIRRSLARLALEPTVEAETGGVGDDVVRPEQRRTNASIWEDGNER